MTPLHLEYRWHSFSKESHRPLQTLNAPNSRPQLGDAPTSRARIARPHASSSPRISLRSPVAVEQRRNPYPVQESTVLLLSLKRAAQAFSASWSTDGPLASRRSVNPAFR
jgi:hypothetical protein